MINAPHGGRDRHFPRNLRGQGRRNTAGRRNRQRGVGLVVILLIIGLLVAVAAAIASLNRGQGSGGDSEKARLDAGTIVSQGGALVSAAIRYSQDRPLSAMTLATTANVGLYDPAQALISQTDAPLNGISVTGVGAGVYKYDSTTINVSGLGTAAAEPAIFVEDIKPLVCKQINKALWNDSIDAALPTSVGSRQEGCATLTTKLTYWKVIVPA